MLMAFRRTMAVALTIVVVGVLGVAAAAAYEASSGGQAFWHTTFYWPNNAWYPFTSVSNARTVYYYSGSDQTRLAEHNVGTYIQNGRNSLVYPFTFGAGDPHIYYSSSQYYFDCTSGYFSGVAAMCSPSDFCASYRSTTERYFDRSTITADGDFNIYTAVGTSPNQHQDDLSAYSFQ